VDQYRIPLLNGRALHVPADQVRRIARGLGDHLEQPDDGREPAIVQALRALPADQRAETLAVVLLRFGGKQDVESIAAERKLSPWQVWQLEEGFRAALAEVQGPYFSVGRSDERAAVAVSASSSADVLLASALAANGSPGSEHAVRLRRRQPG
jgi:hypothetical protein